MQLRESFPEGLMPELTCDKWGHEELMKSTGKGDPAEGTVV